MTPQRLRRLTEHARGGRLARSALRLNPYSCLCGAVVTGSVPCMTKSHLLASGGGAPLGDGLIFLQAAVLLVLVYFVPAVVGWWRHVRHLGSVVVINVFLGWTIIGWVVALAMAVRSREPQPVGSAPPPQWPQVPPAGGRLR
jgi:hypothetical protein